jgi:serine/threonine-protein kinase
MTARGLLVPGARLGPYAIDTPIGAGGMGEVYRAKDTRLGRTVAIKVLHQRADAASARQRLEREARTIAALNHPNICTLFDVGFENDLPYLVMEFLEGQTLDTLLRTGPVPAAAALIYAKQLVAALEAAHARKVIHRDLKPANLFITTSGVLKVLDFGIATSVLGDEESPADTITAGATAGGAFVGTVGYASPEQLRAESVDHRTDIFAAGVVLAELFTNTAVFRKATNAETIAAILTSEPPPLPPTVPPVLAAAIMRCLAKDPPRRFQSARALLDSLESTDLPTATAPAATADVRTAPSIAVLPFADLSPEKDHEYFCDGMADELIAALMGLEGVRVASRSSAFRFKGQSLDVGEIGRRLRVNTVLEGSVRRAGSRLRLSAQLTDVGEGFVVWSDRYDGNVDDVFALQDRIARSIVDVLKVKLGTRADARLVPSASRNFEAYNLFLQGRHAIHKFTKDGMEHGMACYHRALALDPDFAEVHAELGHTFIVLAIFSVAPPRAVMPQALKSVARALELNPNLAAGQLSQAALRLWYEWDWAGAEQSYRRAVELAPADGWPRYGLATFLALRGRHDEAIAHARQAVEADPVSALTRLGLCNALYMARRFDETIKAADESLALEPAFFSTYWAKGLAQAGLGQYAEAVTTLEAGRPFARGDATIEGFLGWAYGLAGETDKARAVAQQLEAKRQAAYVCATHLGIINQGLGDLDTAMRWYEQAYADRATDCSSYARGPHFDVARQDPRFQDLVARIEAGGPERAAA